MHSLHATDAFTPRMTSHLPFFPIALLLCLLCSLLSPPSHGAWPQPDCMAASLTEWACTPTTGIRRRRSTALHRRSSTAEGGDHRPRRRPMGRGNAIHPRHLHHHHRRRRSESHPPSHLPREECATMFPSTAAGLGTSR